MGTGRAPGLSPGADLAWSPEVERGGFEGSEYRQGRFLCDGGPSFGLVSAVYNYNRRSAAITDILRRVFSVAAFNFYDDKYGFEPEDTAASAFALAEKVHWWLGARFDQQKLQLCSDPTILGVTYDLEQYLLKIKKSRKKELFDEISMILEHEELSPGQAGKLRGKLMFGASQLWGKVGAGLPQGAVRSTVFPKDVGYISDASSDLLLVQVADSGGRSLCRPA